MYHSLDKGFLYTIAQILAQEYHAQEQERKLIDLSMRDPLTNINNRHAYNAKLDELSSANSIGIGVLFSDVNGLKYVNDNYGHQAGDRLIIRTVEVLEKYFHKHEIYRISGDEFVVIEENIDEKAFYCKINQVKEDVANVYDGIFAIGQIWKRGKIDIQAMIDEAENQMYQDKEIFYANAPAKKRQHPNKSLLG